jgi:glucose/arabinose dehydrogenase
MQGCLASTSGLIMLPDSKSALVAERTTGAVKEVAVSAEPKVKTVIPVDPSADGGLMDIVLSPTYSQDRLMYAYVSTPTDNRVVRIADGDVPKDILTGIPKGASGNTGALIFTSPTTLVVLTGDAGDAALGADPNSLAGKVIRIEQPTTVDQAPITTAMTEMGAAGGLCTDPADGSLYITDRTPTADRLQRIAPDSTQSTVWTWPDRPGVAGCAALDGTVLVNLINPKQTVAVRTAPETGAVTGEPEVVRQDVHGHAWALEVSPDGNVWAATVNKTFGDAEKLDDVVFPVFPSGGGFPRPQDDLV